MPPRVRRNAGELLTVLEVIVLAVPGVILLAVAVLRHRRPAAAA